MCMFRDLKASEVECRVGQASEKGLSLLLYKDARADMAILDETVGQARWQREHYEVKGNLYCRVGIKINDEWIWKSDCGTESSTEAQKGESSDAFKRACVNWSIGRELYSAPFIWIKKDDCNIYTVQVNNKTIYRCNDNFEVSEIEIKEKTIVHLVITNTTTHKVVYTYGKKAPTVPFPEAEANRKAPATTTPPNPAAMKAPEKTPVEPPKAPTPANSSNLDAERQAAINFVVKQGAKAGITLGQLYKTDRAAYNEYAQYPESFEMAKAITIINEWVGAK